MRVRTTLQGRLKNMMSRQCNRGAHQANGKIGDPFYFPALAEYV